MVKERHAKPIRNGCQCGAEKLIRRVGDWFLGKPAIARKPVRLLGLVGRRIGIVFGNSAAVRRLRFGNRRYVAQLYVPCVGHSFFHLYSSNFRSGEMLQFYEIIDFLRVTTAAQMPKQIA